VAGNRLPNSGQPVAKNDLPELAKSQGLRNKG